MRQTARRGNLSRNGFFSDLFREKVTYRPGATKSALAAAYKAGERFGDTGEFDSWWANYSNKSGVDKQKVKREFERGVEGTPSTAKVVAKKATGIRGKYRGCNIYFDPETKEYFGSCDRDSRFDSYVDVKKHIDWLKKGRNENPSKLWATSDDWNFYLNGGEVYRVQRGNEGPISDTGMPANVRWEASEAHMRHFGPKLYPGFKMKGKINENPIDRFNDLNKQGFMKRLYQKPKKETIYEVINDTNGLVYHGSSKVSAEEAVRKYGGKITKIKNPSLKLAEKYGNKIGGSLAKHLNPGRSPKEITEGFHGRESTEETEILEEETYPDELAGLGLLVELEICDSEDSDKVVPIKFNYSKPDDAVIVACDRDGNIEFVGGDQDLELGELESRFGDLPKEKAKVKLGYVHTISYFADKHHLEGPKYQEKGTEYIHTFGEEGGGMPCFIYDLRNRKMELVGGDYTITDEGIRN